VGTALMLFVDLSPIWALGGGIVGYSLVYCGGMWLLGLNKYEKELVMKPLRKLLKR